MMVDVACHAGESRIVRGRHFGQLHAPVVGQYEAVPADANTCLERAAELMEAADKVAAGGHEQVAAGGAVVKRTLDLCHEVTRIVAVDAELENGVDDGTFVDGPR